MELIFNGTMLRAAGMGLDRSEIIVTFDNWRPKRDGQFPEYGPLQRVLNSGKGHLAIHSTRNDWFLNPETAQMRAALADFTQNKATAAIGFSMGGYGALLFSRELRLKRALLFAPQMSIFPESAPYEARYLKDAKLLDPALDGVAGMRNDEMKGLVLFDPRLFPADRSHAREIQSRFAQMQPCALPFGGHPPIKNFTPQHGYGNLMGTLINDKLSALGMAEFHRKTRKHSTWYRDMLAKHLKRRAERRAMLD